MGDFMIMEAPPLCVIAALVFMFVWGAKAKEVQE
ncbi:cytochrome bd oxidase small subunit CydS [Paenibacillus larvae]